jgi:heterodisulfide reductase subunit C
MLNYNSLDPQFKDQIASRAGGERVTNCYLCGTCTAGCPVSSLRAEYNPRRIMRMVLLGMKKELLSSPEIWQCNQCHRCVAHCPQDARCADIIRILREMACEEGYVEKDMLAKIDKLDEEIQLERIEKVCKLTK